MLLIDGLVGARVLQLRRPVGGQDDERRPRVGGLDDRGVKLGRGRARRRKHHGRLARGLAQADGKERAASFVDLDEDLDARMTLQRHGHRRGPRAGRHASKFHALHRQLVDEGGGERLGYIHRIES